MKKLAIFIDTNYFCKSDKGRYLPIPKTMFKIYDYLINPFSRNITFLTTQVFKTEIEEKIKNLISFTDIEKIFSDYIFFDGDYKDDEITKSINEYREYYKSTIENFIKHCDFIDITLNADDIKFCCDRAYQKKPPFAKKENSWKDCLNLVYIKKWFEINKEEYEVWFVSKDSDFKDIEKNEFGIDFITALDLEALNQRMHAYLKKNNLNYALIYSLFEAENKIRDEVENSILRDFPSLQDIEISIHDIQIISIAEEDKLNGNVIFGIFCGIYGVDYTNATFDKGDKKYRNTEDFDGNYMIEIGCDYVAENNYSQMTIQNLQIINIDLYKDNNNHL